jgi:hypothetical protein
MTKPNRRLPVHSTAQGGLALAIALGACTTHEPGEPLDLETELAAALPLAPPSCELPPGVTIQDGLILLEDDMVLGTEDQRDELCDRFTTNGLGIDPGAFNANRWPGGVVPYRIDEQLPQKWRVTDAIAQWEAATDIQFVDAAGHADYITFKSHNDACNAEVGRKGGEQFVRLSTGKNASQIVGISINEEDHVYTWYNDGMVTIGTSSNLEAIYPQYVYELPGTYTPADIVEIAIHPTTQQVYTWYDDRKYSIGNSRDLGAFQAPALIAQPSEFAMWQVKGIDFAPNGNLRTWYHDNGSFYRVIGHADDLEALGGIAEVEVPAGQDFLDIQGMAIASTSWAYTFFNDKKVSAGTSVDLSAYAEPYAFKTPGHCDTAATVHEIGHALGLKHEHTRCDRDDFVRVYWDNVKEDKEHNFEKQCTGFTDYGAYDKDSIMHYSSTQFSSTESPTILFPGPLGQDEDVPDGDGNVVRMVGAAISSTDKVYAWWDNGTVTSGTSTDLERHRSRYYYTLPEPYEGHTYTTASIVGMAISSSDRVYTFYINNTVTIGTSEDLDYYSGPYEFTAPFSASSIREVGIAANDHVYVWYTGNKATIGTSDDLDAYHAPYDYDTRNVTIRGIDISSADVVYTWYEDGFMSRGNSSDLNAIATDPFRGRGAKPRDNDVLSSGDIATIEAMY